MKKRILKTPSDYETFQFRVTKSQKDHINDLVEDVVQLYNQDRGEDEKAFRKNTIIMEALERGLTQMKRNKAK